jgi:uncharacterized protein (DUF697 family)
MFRMKKTPAKKVVRKKTAIGKTVKTRSRQIHARKTKDAEFMALLRRKCVRAASIGALTAGAEAVPGLGRALGFLFGELVDATVLSNVQRELVDDTFALYEFKLTDSIKSTLVDKIHIVGAGASVTADTAIRAMLKRGLGRAGSLVTYRLMPIAPIVTSALTNAVVTYAVGKRAQAIAKLDETAMERIPDVLRAFTGVDERRVYAWTMDAIKGSTGALSNTFAKIKTTLTPRRYKKT